MLEIIALALFSKKVRSIAEENNISPKKWLWRLVITWFVIEALSIIVFISIFGEVFREAFVMGNFIGIVLAIVSAFYNLNVMKSKENINLLKELEELDS